MLENPSPRRDWLRFTLVSLALLYAFLAGLRLVNETDLGWQMATGRYILEHHHIPSTTLFTYTVPTTPWIYPPLSGVIFYLLFQFGGYPAISWLSAVATVVTIIVATWRGGRLTAALAIIAVPAIAFRTVPRADLFTTVLFAAVFSLLWQYYQGQRTHFWLLPLFMVLWVNLHQGFVAGLALMGAYVFFELADLLFAERRTASSRRLREAIPWLAAGAAATLINPWGIGIFRALSRQDKVTQQLSDFVGEWSSVHFNSLAWQQFLNPRDPASADWWLMLLALLTILVCLWLKRFGPAVLMSAMLYESIKHLRFQALLAILVVIIGGALLPNLFSISIHLANRLQKSGGRSFSSDIQPSGSKRALAPEELTSTLPSRANPLAWTLVLAALVLLVSFRSYDLISNRYYLDAGDTTFFGAGESWWFPEKAMAFLERQHLPANLFHDYNVGGYLTFRVGETYPDFADGRFVPFAGDVFFQQKTLQSSPPDSPEWQQAQQRWNINTLIFSLSRYAGLGAYPLATYCHSPDWKPVYADDVSIIFLRNRPEYSALLSRLTLDCDQFHLPLPATATGDTWRARAERFNFLMNSASAYYILSRDSEAYSALAEAESFFPQNANLHLVKAQLLQANRRFDEAEQQYRLSLRLRPSDDGWFALAALYAIEKRYPEAEQCLQQSIAYSQVPYERLRSLGLLYIAMNQPQRALDALDRAQSASPFTDSNSALARSFTQRLADARKSAQALLTTPTQPPAPDSTDPHP